jgi:SAM-dependent methyltransferase
MADVMRQIYRALKPGGIFVFSVPHPSIMSRRGRRDIPPPRYEEHGMLQFSG